MIVVAVDRLAAPRIEGGAASVLDSVAVSVGLVPLGDNGTTARVHVGLAFPSHGTGVVVDGTQQFQLDACLRHRHNLGEMGDARLIAISAAQNVTNLGTIDHSRLGSKSRRDNGVHGDKNGTYFKKSKK